MSHSSSLINRINEESCHTYEQVVSRVWASHVTRMNESCHTYEWVMSHVWMRRVTRTNESCHTYEWIMSHVWMRHVTRMSASCHTYEWVVSHVWMSHATCIYESSSQRLCRTVASGFWTSCYTYEWVWLWMSDVTCVDKWHDSYTSHVSTCVIPVYMCHICKQVTRLVFVTRDTTRTRHTCVQTSNTTGIRHTCLHVDTRIRHSRMN